ncbi:MAG: hypothetical protein ACFFB5_06190 [Promethearchaeota archaeon]
MRKRKRVITFALLVLIMNLTLGFRLVSADVTATEWSETYSSSPYHDYSNNPERIGSSITVYGWGNWFQAGLAVSVYQYVPYDIYNLVHFRVAVHFNSCGIITPQQSYPAFHADDIIIFIDKEGYYSEQSMIVRDFSGDDDNPYSQGKDISTPSFVVFDDEESEREDYARKTVEFAVKQICGHIPYLGGYFEEMLTHDPDPEDYDNALFSSGDTQARCYWTAAPYDFGMQENIVQTCFNTIDWYQKRINPGAGGMAIKVWARIFLHEEGSDDFEDYYDTPPVYLRINHKTTGGGGGRLP